MQADEVDERRRASAIGILSGVAMGGFVAGTLAARFLSTAATFRVGTPPLHPGYLLLV